MTKTKKIREPYHTPPLDTILAAMKEDPQAIEELTCFYRPYIRTLATRDLYDASGCAHTVVDERFCRELEIKLILSILKFQIR